MEGSPNIISSHRMETLLKNGHYSIISQLLSIQELETPSPNVHPDPQSLLSHNQYVFNTPQELPPSHRSHDHSIPLVPGYLPPNVCPYHHPFAPKK